MRSGNEQDVGRILVNLLAQKTRTDEVLWRVREGKDKPAHLPVYWDNCDLVADACGGHQWQIIFPMGTPFLLLDWQPLPLRGGVQELHAEVREQYRRRLLDPQAKALLDLALAVVEGEGGEGDGV